MLHGERICSGQDQKRMLAHSLPVAAQQRCHGSVVPVSFLLVSFDTYNSLVVVWSGRAEQRSTERDTARTETERVP